MRNPMRILQWLALVCSVPVFWGCAEAAQGTGPLVADSAGGDGVPADSAAADATNQAADAANQAADAADGQGGTWTALPTPTGMTLLGTAKAGAVQAQLFAAQPLFTGMNPVFYRLQDAQGVLMEGQLTHQAQMAMTPPHGCPATQPPGQAAGEALFEGLLIPQMPSDSQQPWNVQLNFAPPSGAPQKFEFADLPVVAQPLVKTVKGADGHTYVVAQRLAAKTKLGKNPLTISVHRASADDLTYAAVTDATVKLTTLMVSMGHGSNGNVNPAHKKDGLYDGVASFSMPGDWRISFGISLNGATVGSASFDLKI